MKRCGNRYGSAEEDLALFHTPSQSGGVGLLLLSRRDSNSNSHNPPAEGAGKTTLKELGQPPPPCETAPEFHPCQARAPALTHHRPGELRKRT